MFRDRAPIERSSRLETIVTVKHTLQPSAGAAWLEKLDRVTARQTHSMEFCADSFDNEMRAAASPAANYPNPRRSL